MITKRKGMLQRILTLLLVVCLVCSNGLMSLADEAVASTMRLTKTEGTVSVTNKNGRDMGTMADMKLFHGYCLATAQKSYAWMNLDDHKLVKLDAVSEAEIQKKGKNLEVLLNSGNLLFDVKESLKADETLNVRTSTMVTGIRGTCGWVKVIDSSRTRVYILEGQVECFVTDPVTGQSKNITLRSGETADFVVYDQTRAGDKCDIIINRFDEKQIDGFVAVELLNDAELQDRVDDVLNIDLNWISANAPTVLFQSQNEVEQKIVSVSEASKQQENTVVKDPVFAVNNNDDDNDGGGGSGETTPDEPTGLTEITLTIEEAEANDQLNFYLSMDTMKTVTIKKGDEENSDHILNIENATTIALGQEVIIGEGIDLEITKTSELRINGELTVMDGVVYNYGSITNTNLHSFEINGHLYNYSGAAIENTGRIAAESGFINNGSLTSSGILDAVVTVEQGGTLELLSNSTTEQDVEVGELTVFAGENGYVTIYNDSLDVDNLGMDGGTVELVGVSYGSLELEKGHIIVSEGAQVDELILGAATAKGTANEGGSVELVRSEEGEFHLSGGNVARLNQTGGTLDVSDGEATTISIDNTVFTMSGGEVGTLGISYDDTYDTTINPSVSGGSITSFEINKYFVAEKYPQIRLAVEEGQNSTTAIEILELGQNVEFEMSGGTIKELNAMSDVVVNHGTVNNLIADGSLVKIGGTDTTYENTITNNIEVTNGDLTINEGNHGEVALYSSTATWNGGKTNQSVMVYDGSSVDISSSYDGKPEISHLSIQDGTVTMYDGVITDGVVISNADSILTVNGGEIHAGPEGTNVPAIEYYAGEVTISANAKIMAEDAANFIALGPDIEAYNIQLNGVAVDMTDFPVCTKEEKTDEEDGSVEENKKDEVILKRYATSLIDALEEPQDGDYVMLAEDTEWSGTEEPDGRLVVAMFNYATTTSNITLDLNGHELSADSTSTISVGKMAGDSNSLTICDSGSNDGKGRLILNTSLTNRANLTLDGVNFDNAAQINNLSGQIIFKDSDFTTSSQIYNEAGYIEFSGGTCKSTYFEFITNQQGTICITDSAQIDIDVKDYDGFGGISTAGGNVYVGVSEDGNVSTGDPVTVNMTLDTQANENLTDTDSALRFIFAGTGASDINDTFEGEIILGNVDLDVEYGQAVYFDSSAHQLIIKKGAKISSDSSIATIQSYLGDFENAILFNGGEVINTYSGSGNAIQMNMVSYDTLSAMLAPDKLKTELKSTISEEYPEPSIVSTTTSDGILVPYEWDEVVEGYDYSFTTEKTLYCVTGNTTPSTYSLLRNRFEASEDVEDDETEDLVVATASNATASNATASNASGTPTSSKSGIPMAVAMLAGLMAIAPKLFEERADKKRKER